MWVGRGGEAPATNKHFMQQYSVQRLSLGTYRIAGNFRGLYILRIAIKLIFAETNFVDCMIKATPTQILLAAVSWL